MKIRSFLIILTILLFMCPIVYRAEGRDVTVAVIDTGVSRNAVNSENILEGKNYVCEDTSDDDTEGHGTAIASIIAGAKKIGIRGVCEEANIIPLVFYSDIGNGSPVRANAAVTSWIIRDAVDVYGCNIINMSSGTDIDTAMFSDVCKYAEDNNVLIVSSAGNDGTEKVYYPGGYSSALCVSALDETMTKTAKFSNYHSAVDIAAPGMNFAVADMDGSKISVSGTSFSTAYVSGFAAQLMREYPELDAKSVRHVLVASARDIMEEGYDVYSGWGALDEGNARRFIRDGQIFRDVSKDKWYFDWVNLAVEKNIVSGTDEVHFSPERVTSRAMFWMMLYRMRGHDDKNSCTPWYANAREWAIDNGISDGTNPDSPITREQFVTMLMRYAEFCGKDVSERADTTCFADAGTISDYARDAVSWAVTKNIIQKSDKFQPKVNTPRAQSATMLVRFADNV